MNWLNLLTPLLFKLMENAMVPGAGLGVSGTADLSRPSKAKA